MAFLGLYYGKYIELDLRKIKPTGMSMSAIAPRPPLSGKVVMPMTDVSMYPPLA